MGESAVSESILLSLEEKAQGNLAQDAHSPFKAWHGRKPDAHFMRTFGSVVHARRARPGLKKLNGRCRPMIFIGYGPGTKDYQAPTQTESEETPMGSARAEIPDARLKEPEAPTAT